MTTGQQKQLESLIVRGLPPRLIASQLGIPYEKAAEVAQDLTHRGELEAYHRECIARAADDDARYDAATYLYVRNVPQPRIREVCRLGAGFKFDTHAKMRFQDKQLELARHSVREFAQAS